MLLNKFGFKIAKPCFVRKGKKPAQLIRAGNQKAGKIQTTIKFRARSRPSTVKLPLAEPLSSIYSVEGSHDAPIAISDNEEADTLPSSTTIIAKDDRRSQNNPAISLHTTNMAEGGADSAEAQADEGPSRPTIASTLPGKRCLIKIRRYRQFREGLFRLFAITKLHTRHMTFIEVLEGINKDHLREQKFTSLEAKRALKRMQEKLFDSLCIDRVVDLEWGDIELYA
ncbi:hypothetical protein ACET3X_007230 [Alternaria dauci]|uniref:MCM3-like winged helix domain-containing protein n=1 Tax=Alternaria dauci TaxID=48095 RepID=A0ABR3UBW6_9PLEO